MTALASLRDLPGQPPPWLNVAEGQGLALLANIDAHSALIRDRGSEASTSGPSSDEVPFGVRLMRSNDPRYYTGRRPRRTPHV
jgi:hypothetical protein